MKVEVDMPTVLKTIGLGNLPLVSGFCVGSCFYSDAFYRAATNQRRGICDDGSTADLLTIIYATVHLGFSDALFLLLLV